MRNKLSLLVLALMACGAANAAPVGDVASVQASLTFAAQNTTNATWTQAPSLSSASSINLGDKLGTLNIQLTGSHSGVYVTAEGSDVTGGIVGVPFKDASGNAYLWGRTANSNIPQLASVDMTGHNGPGWRLESAADNFDIDFVAFDNKDKVAPGQYTATFYIQQYQS